MGSNDERSKADRRAFLLQCGRFAVVTPPVVSLLLSVGDKAGAEDLETSGVKKKASKTTTTQKTTTQKTTTQKTTTKTTTTGTSGTTSTTHMTRSTTPTTTTSIIMLLRRSDLAFG